MEIKPDSLVSRTASTSATSQTGESHNNSSQQPQQTRNANSLAPQFKQGQLIELIVSKLTTSEALLNIVGTKNEVRTSDIENLQLGQRLQAKVTQIQPDIIFKVTATSARADQTTKAIINQVLRQIMPQQKPLTDLIHNLNQQIKSNEKINPAIPKIRDQFIQSIPPSQAFEDAAIIPKILQRSGNYTEFALSQMVKTLPEPKSFPNNDLKIALLRMASQLRELLPLQRSTQPGTGPANTPNKAVRETYDPAMMKLPLDSLQQNSAGKPAQTNTTAVKKPDIPITEQAIEKLLVQTEGAIAKIKTQQIQQHQQADPQKPNWLFELPIRTESSIDNITIYINRDDSESKNAAYQSSWNFILKLNIEKLGLIQVKVNLSGKNISLTFWIENNTTSKMFSEHIKLLTGKLNKSGLETGNINMYNEAPPPFVKQKQPSTFSETT